MSTQATAAANGSNTLVVLLHGYTRTPADLIPIESAVAEKWPKAQYLRPPLELSLFSMADPDAIVADLLADIESTIEARRNKGDPIGRVVLVGHSAGALLARKLYVVACGETAKAPFEPVYHERLGKPVCRAEWAGLIERIVLLAGMNRGWRLSHHISVLRYPMWLLGSAAGNLIHMLYRQWPFIFKIRRGAEFITALRIQWIAMRQRTGVLRCGPPSKDPAFGETERRSEGAMPATEPRSVDPIGNALTIQLLGSVDDMVSPEDNVDLVAGGDFVYLDVPYSGHLGIVEFDDVRSTPDGQTRGAIRKDWFQLALTATEQELVKRALLPVDENDAYPLPDPTVRHVVFVIHGIRDEGFWTQKIARRVKKLASQSADGAAARWESETSSYGYFPMLPFLFYAYRRKRVEWLMDQYAQALAHYPCAKFYYVGHSNGTYLLAEALELYPSCRFERAVLAGSVISRRYSWTRFTEPPAVRACGPALTHPEPRLKAVLNLVATADWVVAWFPKAFQLFGSKELGSLGHDGFQRIGTGMYEIRYVRGGHGTAIEEDMWDTVAEFVLTGRKDAEKVPASKRANPPFARSFWEGLVRALGRFPPLVWVAAAAIFYCIWRLIALALAGILPDPSLDYAKGLATAIYALFLWLVVTRV